MLKRYLENTSSGILTFLLHLFHICGLVSMQLYAFIFYLSAHLSIILCIRAVVHIQVEDVNEFSPSFHEPVYQATVTEGKIYDSIVQVEAWDQDCSAQYSQICNYEIITQNTPFAIDRNGEAPLSLPHLHILTHKDKWVQ